VPEIRPAFDDAPAYERYMGRWSRVIGEKFLDWLSPPRNARWLDIGCGTGAFSELILAHCAPKALSGIDPSSAQVDFARTKLPTADVRVTDSMAVPFADGAFDVVASALVLHFIPDRSLAFAEMKRVACPGGLVGAYTWKRTPDADFAPYAAMLRAFRSIGIEPTRSPTVPEQTPDGLRGSAEAAGFMEVEVTEIEASQSFQDFGEYWQVQTLPVSPIGRAATALDEPDRARLREAVRQMLPICSNGSITYAARAVAMRARV
jgi:SAM-dependent methyltransferase